MNGRISITTLGDLAIQQNGKTVAGFPSRKVEALLVYLAVERGTAHRRESLFTLLWPGMPEGSARHNLRQVLYALRQTFPDVPGMEEGEPVPLVLTDRQTARLNPEAAVAVDLHQLDSLLESTQVHDHLNLAGCETCV